MCQLLVAQIKPCRPLGSLVMGRKVDIDDLIDADQVAKILGLSSSRAVYVYLDRYPDMPRPALDRGRNKARLWLRPEIANWVANRAKTI